MNLVLDYGNTLAKVGIFDHDQLIEKTTIHNLEGVNEFLENFSGGNIIVSSVSTEKDKLIIPKETFQTIIYLTHEVPLPIKNYYVSPATLGVDRLAGVCGAVSLKPGHNSLIIDAGTCITYDFIDSANRFLGGAISPGLQMRFKAMNQFTARLPLVSPVEETPLIGNNTIACMQSGVVNGMIEEINGIIKRYSDNFEGLQVFLTGGDAQFFENKLKASIFAVPELVLRGLNSILLFNIQ